MTDKATWTVSLRAGPLLDSVFTTVTVAAASRAEAITLAKREARAAGFGRDRHGKQGPMYVARAWER